MIPGIVASAYGRALAPPVTTTAASLLHYEGADHASVFTDEVGTRIWTPHGSPELSTTRSYFGGSSLSLDGSSYISSPNMALPGDWTFETFLYYYEEAAATQGVMLLGNMDQDNDRLQLVMLNGTLGFYYTYLYGPSYLFNSGGGVSPEMWNHIVLQRSGDELQAFVNGALYATAPLAYSIPEEGAALGTNRGYFLGAARAGGTTTPLFGNMDETRLTLGAALYPSSGFTPPSSPLT